MACGALLAAAAVAVVALRPGWIAAAPTADLAEMLAVQTRLWTLYLAVGGGLLILAAVALRHRAAAAVVALQLLALLQLFPLVRTAPAATLRRPAPWVETLASELPGPPWAVLNTRISRPSWEPPPGFRLPPEGTRALNDLRNALDLYPGTGVAHGLTYPLAPDIEGMSSPLYTFLSVEVTRLDWPGRLAWLRATGVQALVANRAPSEVPTLAPTGPPHARGPSRPHDVSPFLVAPDGEGTGGTAEPPPGSGGSAASGTAGGGAARRSGGTHSSGAPPGLRLLDQAVRDGVTSRLYAVDHPAPDAWWPRRVESAPGPQAALHAVAGLEDPVSTVVTARPVEHSPEGRVEVTAQGADWMELRVESAGGGLLALRRSYHPLYRVRAGPAREAAPGATAEAKAEAEDWRTLPTLPVQVALLGIEVPPGAHRVVLDVDDRPEIAATVLSLLTLLAAAVVVVRSGRRRSPPAPDAARGAAKGAAASTPGAPASPLRPNPSQSNPPEGPR